MDRLYLIYKHTCNVTGKSYIGQTCNLKQRISSHRIPSSKCTLIRNAIQKHGWESFTTEILVEGLTLEQANKTEEFLIAFHNTISPNGYNLRSGGENQLICEETKKHWSAIRKGKPRSKEHQEKLNIAARNHVRSPEHHNKLIEKAKRPRSEAFKQRLSIVNKGKVVSDATRRKLSEANKGKKASTEQIAKRIKRNTGRRMYINIVTGERKYFYPKDFTTSLTDMWIAVKQS